MAERPPTPVLQRMHEVNERSQIIGEFLDWLINQQGVTLMRWDSRTVYEPCPRRWRERQTHEEMQTTVDDLRELEAELAGVDPTTLPERPLPPPPPHPEECSCGGTGRIGTQMEDWVPWEPRGVQRMLGRYFDIDVDAAAAEKDRLLQWVREGQK